MDKKFLIGVIVASLVIMFGGAVLAFKMGSNSPQVEVAEGVRAVVEEETYDWGEIGINNGNVEKVFKVKNEGSKTLKLFNVSTSCMCTTAQIITGDRVSPAFGMHDKSSYVAEVEPGGEAEVKVVFDPAYHGPNGVGPITRQVLVQTNDSSQPELEFMLAAMVTK